MPKSTTAPRPVPRTASPEQFVEEIVNAESELAALLAQAEELRGLILRLASEELVHFVPPLSTAADQRLIDAEDRSADLERRLALLEARLSPSPEWEPEPGNMAEEGLLAGYRLADGSVSWSADKASGDAIHDMSTGALRPRTWPQLLSCLIVLASSVDVLVDDHDVEVDPDGVLKAVSMLIDCAGIHR